MNLVQNPFAPGAGSLTVRASLISKGMTYSPGHGDNAFTVLLFDEFMKRIMPEKPGK